MPPTKKEKKGGKRAFEHAEVADARGVQPSEITLLFFCPRKKRKKGENNLEHGEVADAAIDHKVVHLQLFFSFHDLVSASGEKEKRKA